MASAPETSSTDLTQHKDKFIRLYIDEKRTLKDVKEILLREDGCNASSNMYQKMIRKWNIRKNLNHDQMLEFLGAIQRRKIRGKPPIIWSYHRQTYTEQDASRYFERKYGLTINGAIKTFLEPVSANKDKQGGTLTMTISMTELDQVRIEFFDLTRAHQRQHLEPYTFPKAALQGKLDGNDVAVSKVLQRRRMHAQGPHLLEKLFVWFSNGLCLVAEQKWKAGFASLHRSFTCIREALSIPDPQLLLHAMTLARHAMEMKQAELGKMLARQFHGYSCILHGPNHIFSRWCVGFLRAFDSIAFLEQGLQATCDFTSEVLGPTDAWSFGQRQFLVNCEVGMAGDTVQTAIQRHERNLREAEMCSDISTSNKFSLIITTRALYSCHLRSFGCFAEAAKALEDIPNLLDKDYQNPRHFMTVFCAVPDLVECMIQEGNHAQGIKLLEKAIDRSADRVAHDDPARVHLLTILSGYYEKYGNQMGADSVEEEISSELKEFRLPENENL